MIKNYNISGMKSIFIPEIYKWNFIEKSFRKIIESYCYDEIKLQILEDSNLFLNSLGNNTDVVSKEMFSFFDKSGKSLTLIPEGTAPCIKFLLENGFLRNNSKLNVWYVSPMFRRERPQYGRQRLFYQIGVESYGFDGIYKEIEHLLIFYRLLNKLNIFKLILEVNCLDNFFISIYYNKVLLDFFNKFIKNFNEQIDVMRLLDKSFFTNNINFPKYIFYLSAKNRKSFLYFIYILKKFNIPFILNFSLVRGLDYYNGIIYEWTYKMIENKRLTVCAGGRYNDLSEKIYKIRCYSTGFAFGIERLLNLISQKLNNNFDIFLVLNNFDNFYIDLKICEEFRSSLPNKKIFLGINSKKNKKSCNSSVEVFSSKSYFDVYRRFFS